MKRNHLTTLAAVAFCLVATPLMADETATTATDPSGTFSWTQDYGQGEADHCLVLNADGDDLTGIYCSGDLCVPLQDGKIEDGEFSFKIELDIDGTTIEVVTTGKVEGDKLTGVSTIDDGGDGQESDLQAERNTRPEDVIGTWNVTIEAEGQIFEHVAEVTQDGETLMVEYLTDEFGDHDAVDVKLADNKLSFTIAVESPEGGLELKFDTKPRGGKLTGELEYQVGDITGSTEIEAEREVPQADIVGTWNMTIDAEGQTFEPTMVVTKKDDKLAIEYLTDEFGDHEAVDVKLDGDKLSFVIEVESPEGSIKLTVTTKVVGDELGGEVEYEVGDISGTAEIEGERETSDDEDDDEDDDEEGDEEGDEDDAEEEDAEAENEEE